jgi:hypothetical protein
MAGEHDGFFRKTQSAVARALPSTTPMSIDQAIDSLSGRQSIWLVLVFDRMQERAKKTQPPLGAAVGAFYDSCV